VKKAIRGAFVSLLFALARIANVERNSKKEKKWSEYFC